MTLVYRAQKQRLNVIQNPNVGPGKDIVSIGSYFNDKKVTSLKNDFPFISKSGRFQNSMDRDIVDSVGPGCYEITTSPLIKIATDCKSVFSSKVPRFPSKSIITVKDPQQLQNQLTKIGTAFWKDQNTEIPGKIYKLNQSSNKKLAKSIPSIPTWQQSYGYHYDNQSRQLISNKNPNILITHTQVYNQQWKNAGPGYYLIKQQQKNVRGVKWVAEKQKKQIESNIGYLKQNSKKYWQNKGNNIISKQERFKQNKGQIKKQLLIQKMEKQFKDYLQNKSPSQLINYHPKNITKKSSNYHLLPSTNHQQCFLSKSSRFVDSLTQNLTIPQKSNSPLCQINSPSQSNNNQISKVKIQIPFGIKQQRFSLDSKRNIGPGYYQGNTQFLGKKGVSIKFQAKRFDEYCHLTDSPGPSHYYPQRQKKKKQKKERKEKKNIIQNKQISKQNISIESLYEAYGRQVNSLIKIQKSQYQNKQNKSDIGFLSKVTRKCLQQINKQQNKRQVDLHMISHDFRKKKINKYPKRQYKFEPPCNKHPTPGPGDFQISTTLEKKTFNVTYE